MISQLLQSAFTGGVALGIWWSHVCWKVAQNVSESHLIVDHLVLESSSIKTSQILMRPSVRSDLMTFSNHALNESRPMGIDGTFAEIVSSDHKGRLGIVGLQFVQKIRGVVVGAIVEGKCDVSCSETIVDSSSTVWDRTQYRASNASCRCSRR